MPDVPSMEVTGKQGTSYYGYIGTAYLFDPEPDGSLDEWAERVLFAYFPGFTPPERPTEPTWFVRLPAEPISWWGTEEELNAVFNVRPDHKPA